MTLKQLQYVVTVADEGNITSAAKKLFIAQPSLTAAIHELENEFNITIFIRSNKGIKLTPEGEEFLGYARQVLDQTELIEERYAGKESGKIIATGGGIVTREENRDPLRQNPVR